jgi:hypothetical protein
MKAGTVHIAVFCLLLALCGCGRNREELSFPMQPAPMLLDLNIVMPRAGETLLQEQVKELRFIMIDEATGNVEFNHTLDVSRLQPTEDSHYLYGYEQEFLTTEGWKVMYALANVEEQIRDIVSLPSGAEIMEGLDKLEQTEMIGSLHPDGNIPLASRKYRVKLELKTKDGTEPPVSRVKIAMVYAAVKFDLSLINNLSGEERQDLRIVGWSINRVASQSYLIPHMDDESWLKMIEIAGNEYFGSESDPWIRNYEVPADAGHYDYVCRRNELLILPKKPETEDNTPVHDPITYYLHESRNMAATSTVADEPGDQEYMFSLRVLLENMGENDNPIIFGPVKLPNLKSLVRGTHVKIEAKINKEPDAGVNDLEVRVKTWEKGDIVDDGGWEEVTE